MRRILLTTIVFATARMVFSPAAPAQQTRSIHVWVDTLRLNICEDNSQFLIPVEIDSLLTGDSVFAISATVQWDRSAFDLDTRLVTAGTLAEQAPNQSVQKDPSGSGQMFIQIGDITLSGVIDGPGPLFYLIGSVTAPDTVGMPNGWITVAQISFESRTRFEPIYSPGYVEVVRDTTPQYTGTISVSDGELDTLEADTLTVSVVNLRRRGVNRVEFSIAADTSYYEFIDTLEVGTLAAQPLWSSRDVSLSGDSVHAVFDATSDLEQDGPLLRLAIRRRTDSAFSRLIRVTDFGINAGSCLGRLVRQDGTLMAAAIVHDTSTVSVAVDETGRSGVSVVMRPGSSELEVECGSMSHATVEVFDLLGRRIEIQRVNEVGPGRLAVLLGTVPPRGVCFLVLRDRQRIVCKQFLVI